MHTPLKKHNAFLCLKTTSLKGGSGARGGGRSRVEGGEVVVGGRKKIWEG